MWGGALCWSLCWYELLCVLSSFENTLTRKEKAGCFSFIALRMSSYCSVVLSHDAVGWVQCD